MVHQYISRILPVHMSTSTARLLPPEALPKVVGDCVWHVGAVSRGEYYIYINTHCT